MGSILSVFAGGLMIEKFGGKYLSALLGLVTPVAAKCSPILLTIIRILQGVCQGPLVPAFQSMAHKWFPVQEKTFLMTATISGRTFNNSL